MTRGPRIALLLTGSSSAKGARSWAHGEVVELGVVPAQQRTRLESWLARSDAEAALLWDGDFGPPDAEHLARLLAGRGDVWHAGLHFGSRGWPGLLDFVAPHWMLNCDPPAAHEASSWRVTPACMLVRTEVLRRLGLPQPEFDSAAGAWLEWGHRCMARGALMRHVPGLVTAVTGAMAEAVPLVDEFRFIASRYGKKWATWALGRALATGYAPVTELLAAFRQTGARSYPEPAPYPPHEVNRDAPPLAQARVTVLIPTLNRYPYLRVLFENLRAQTVRPHEIMVVDQTTKERRDEQLLRDFTDLPLRFIYLDEPGQCISRNAGLKACSGDHVLFLDDDGEVPPDLIERHLRNLHRFDADVSSGVVHEAGASSHDAPHGFVRQSDVFPTGNTMVRRRVLVDSGLFDVAYNRAPRADGDLGMRVYSTGSFMILDQANSILHHRAAEGGLRTHGARVTTYRMSREQLTKRNLPHISEIYLLSRYFSERQRTESLWLRTVGTLSARGDLSRRAAKVLVSSALLPDTIKQTLDRSRAAKEWLTRFPQIDRLD